MDEPGSYKTFKELIKTETWSSTKIESLNKLFRRLPDEDTKCVVKFTFLLKVLKSKKILYVDKIVFTKQIPWSIMLSPKIEDGILVYDVTVRCLFPNVMFLKDSEVDASIKLAGPQPISMLTISHTFRTFDNELILSNCIPEAKLRSAKKYEFSLTIQIKSDRTKHHKSLPPVKGIVNISKKLNINRSEVDYIHDHLCSSKLSYNHGSNHAMDIFNALLNLLSEDTIKTCDGKSWYLILEFLTSVVMRYKNRFLDKNVAKLFIDSGLLDHIISLLKADFTEGDWSYLALGLLVRLSIQEWRQYDISLVHKFHGLSYTIKDKIFDVRSGLRSHSRLIFDTYPTLLHSIFKCEVGIGCLLTNPSWLNDVVEPLIRNFLPYFSMNLVKHLETKSLKGSYRLSLDCHHAVKNLYLIYDILVKAFIDNPDVSSLTKLAPPTVRRFLVTIGEVMVNPYIEPFRDILTFVRLIQRDIALRHGGEYHEFWMKWLDYQADREPLLSSLIYQTDHMVHRDELEDLIGMQYKYYHSVIGEHTFYNGMLKKMLKYAFFEDDPKCEATLKRVEEAKEMGNEKHKQKKFLESVDLYTTAIKYAENGAWKIAVNRENYDNKAEYSEAICPFFNLTAILRSNRANSNFECENFAEVVADSTIALILVNSMKHVAVKYPCNFVKNNASILLERVVKLRYRRVKAWLELGCSGPALHDLLFILQTGQSKATVLPIYYDALYQYISNNDLPMFPHFCVVCSTDKSVMSFSDLTERCGKCKHPYCSQYCKKQDSLLHQRHCKDLIAVVQHADYLGFHYPPQFTKFDDSKKAKDGRHVPLDPGYVNQLIRSKTLANYDDL